MCVCRGLHETRQPRSVFHRFYDQPKFALVRGCGRVVVWCCVRLFSNLSHPQSHQHIFLRMKGNPPKAKSVREKATESMASRRWWWWLGGRLKEDALCKELANAFFARSHSRIPAAHNLADWRGPFSVSDYRMKRSLCMSHRDVRCCCCGVLFDCVRVFFSRGR